MSNGGEQPGRKLSPEDEYSKKLISDIKPISREEAENQPDFVEPEETTGEEEQQDDHDQRPSLDDVKKAMENQRIKKTPEEQLSENKVPKYSQEPSGVYKEPPGGPAIEPKRPNLPQRGGQPVSSGVSKTGQTVGTGVQKAGQAIAQATKKAAQAVAKFAAQAAGRAIAVLAPYWLPILLVIIAIVAIIFGVFMLIKALQTPNAGGASPVQAADILDDHPLIKTVLALSDKNEFQKLLENNKTELLSEIASFETEINTKFSSDTRLQPTLNLLTEVKKLILEYNTPNAEKAVAIKSKLVEAIKPWSVTLNPGGLIFPASGFSATNPGRGSDYYKYQPAWGRRTHRGIDRGLSIGTLFRAPADSEIVYLNETACRDNTDAGWRNNCNGGFGNAIIGKIITPGPWQGYYWEIHHLKQYSASVYGVKNGTQVKQGQIIGQSGHNGKSSKPHIHFQIDKPGAESRGFPVGVGRESETIDPYIALGWPR